MLIWFELTFSIFKTAKIKTGCSVLAYRKRSVNTYERRFDKHHYLIQFEGEKHVVGGREKKRKTALKTLKGACKCQSFEPLRIPEAIFCIW